MFLKAFTHHHRMVFYAAIQFEVVVVAPHGEASSVTTSFLPFF